MQYDSPLLCILQRWMIDLTEFEPRCHCLNVSPISSLVEILFYWEKKVLFVLDK